MIPYININNWRLQAPWKENFQVEHDLVISRALVDLYSFPGIAERVAFRGGTALHKLHITPPARYSEDIDLVQIRDEPIGETLDLMRSALRSWLGEPKRDFKHGRIVLKYRYQSEDTPSQKIRLKIEINSREQFTVLGHTKMPFSVENPWFSGSADLTTITINEILSTKLRALYQRKKGRDLFDLAIALPLKGVDPELILRCFDHYMKQGGHKATRAQFEANLHYKSTDELFRNDINALLGNTDIGDFDSAMQLILEKLISLLPGGPWKGEEV